MSYLVYLNHYDIRQCKAQYLSVFYEVLGKNLDSYFILNRDYLEEYEVGSRWEIRWANNHWGYDKVKKRINPDKCIVMQKPQELINIKNLVPSQILRKVVDESIPTQVEVIEKILKEKDIKAGITWVNNKCFRDTLKEHSLVTFHHEMGPFRPTCYEPTIYLDLQGVNGDTEFNARFKEFLKVADQVPILTRQELIRVVSPNNYKALTKILFNEKREYEIGVGLQVEVDTNLLLFNKGVSWVDPILRAEMDSYGRVLVRPHPAAGYSLKPIDSRIVVDDLTQGNAQNFINKCDKIYCLNSSVGLEAMLLGREAKIFGDSPFTSICNMNEDMRLIALNFVVFGYLIHRKFLFNNDYIIKCLSGICI